MVDAPLDLCYSWVTGGSARIVPMKGNLGRNMATAIGTYLKEKGPELLILGIVGFGALQLWNLQGDIPLIKESISALSEKRTNEIAAVNKRIDGISDALREVRTSSAYEILYRPMEFAVITTNPTRQLAGGWSAYINMLDFKDGTFKTYRADVSGPDDHGLIWAVGGSVHELDATAVAVNQAEAAGKSLKVNAFAPNYVNKEYSFIAYETLDMLHDRIEKLGGKFVKTYPMKPDMSWSDLSKELRKYPGKYTGS